MEYRLLGGQDSGDGLRVSVIGLGTMTFGEQNSQADAFAQLDCALDAGVNFIDTAEMYAIPPRPQTQGSSERIIGNWMRQRGQRDRVILATKVLGRSTSMTWFRDGSPRLDRANIIAALQGSLERLQTDYIDLYQVHWPDRPTNYFGQLGYRHQVQDDSVPIEETLTVLAEQVTAGRVRHIGISNETPWGVMAWLRAAERLNLPRVVSIQNPYNLLNRIFEIGLAEVAHHESVPLLAYSPLGFGTLSGKYLTGEPPAGSRLARFPQYGRYTKPRAVAATERYVAIAREAGLPPEQLALAYVNSRPFLASTIIGATNLAQLRSNLASTGITLSPELLEAIEAVHDENPNPAP